MNIDDLIKNTPLEEASQEEEVKVPLKPSTPTAQGSPSVPPEPLPTEEPSTGMPSVLPPIPNMAATPEAKPVAPKEPTVMDKYKNAYNKTLDVATGINTAIQPQVEGLINLATPKGSWLSKKLEERHKQREIDWQKSSQRSPILSRVGYWGSLFGGGYATAGRAAAGGLAAQIGKGAASGAAWGATQYTPDDNWKKIAARTAIGGTLGGAIPAGVGLLSGAKGAALPGAGAGGQQAARDIEQTAQTVGSQATKGAPIRNPIMEAAERQGVPVAPAQALDSPALAAEVASRRVPMQTKLDAEKYIGESQGKLRTKVGEVIDSMVPEGRDAARAKANSLYGEIADVKIRNEQTSAYHAAPYLDAVKAVKDSFPEMKDGTVGFQQKVIENLYDQAQGFKRGATPDLWKAKKVDAVRQELSNHLGTEVPKYKVAQQIWQRVKLQEELTDALGNRKVLAGRSDLTPGQIRSTIAGSPDMEDEFLTNVSRAGGSAQQAKDVLTLLEAHSKPSGLGSVISGASPDKLNAQAGLTQQAWNILTSRVGGREARDRGFVELMTNPKWATDIKKIKQISNAEQRIARFGNVLSRAAVTAGVGVANQGGNEPQAATAELGDPAETGAMIENMPLNPDQGKVAETAAPPIQDYKPTSITASVVKDGAARKALQEVVAKLPPKKQEQADDLLNMDPDEFYKTSLGTKEARMKFLKQMRDKGFNVAKVYKQIKELEEIKEDMDAVKNTPAPPSVAGGPGSGGMGGRRMGLGAGLLGLIFSLFGTVLTGKPMGVFSQDPKQGGLDIGDYADSKVGRGGLLSRLSGRGNSGLREAKAQYAFEQKMAKQQKTLERKKEGLLIDLMAGQLEKTQEEKDAEADERADIRFEKAKVRAEAWKVEHPKEGDNKPKKIRIPL